MFAQDDKQASAIKRLDAMQEEDRNMDAKVSN